MTDDIENIKVINSHIYNLLNSNDTNLADKYFYFEVPKKYKEDVAEHFNDSNWLHYNLLDSTCAKSTFARTMLNLNSELEDYTNENEFAAILSPFVKISNANTNTNTNTNTNLNSNEVYEDEDVDVQFEDHDDHEYRELLKFKSDMLTFFSIAIGTSLAVATTYYLNLKF